MTRLSELTEPRRVIAELRELQHLTGDEDGAQRVCWTEAWLEARSWLEGKLRELGAEYRVDAAANAWATLPGREPARALLIGGHIDSVRNGGWLDGALNLVAGLEVLRALRRRGTPPVSVRLVDWADEEGARFGRGLVGSSAASGTLDPSELHSLRDRAGAPMHEVLAGLGVDVALMARARTELEGALAYLELHIEQGPVLEGLGRPLAAVTGTVGVERHVVTFGGQALHAGSAPMAVRRDPLAAAARLVLAVREHAVAAGALATVGGCVTEPGIPTATAERVKLLLDQRHPRKDELDRLLERAVEESRRIASDELVSVDWTGLWRIDPIAFDNRMIGLVEAAIEAVAATAHRMPSGPLHDAAEVARAGVPSAMLFVRSIGGVSHNKSEDTDEDDLALSVAALAEAVDQALLQLEA